MDARRQFEPDARVLPEVRRFVSEAAEVAFDHPAVLVGNELAANAVRHAGTPFTVRVRRNPTIRIDVSDLSNTPPRLSEGDRGGGYGLRVVEALSERWGTETAPDGKTVWAEVPPGQVPAGPTSSPSQSS